VPAIVYLTTQAQPMSAWNEFIEHTRNIQTSLLSDA